MNKFKRKLVFNELLEEPTKKFRNHLITCLEYLSNEIFYEIFDYLNGCEIVETFSNLNSRFKQLLYSSSLLIKTHFYLFNYDKMINTFNELEIFSTEIYSNLKILSIHCSDNIIFLDAYRWKKLILHYYPQLEIFYFIYYDRMNNDNQYSTSSYGLNQFSSSFWIQHRWIFNVQIDNTDIKYMVYPYRNTWYNYILEDKNIQYSTSTSLKLISSDTLYDDMMIDDIKRILVITHVYHLNIHKTPTSICLLIRMIDILPDLLTLKIYSLLLDGDRGLNMEEFSIFCAKRNRINAVYVEVLNNIHCVGSLFMVCHYIKHFQVKHIINMNIQMFLQIILKEITHRNNHYLHSLCFHETAANYQTIEYLQEINKYEQLLVDFTIKRINNNIYLQWK
ncbi:unnamed protein product [Rotaria sp. Silwood1]|nr:unnamed protein product [Rotaria sp. Silwood1]CAF1111199.1 unnamed protein product [Rotaria sp. Silwood1]